MDARLRRQEILDRVDAPCRLHAVIDENAITRIIDPEVRTIQLNHLATMADRSNVTIQLIPTSASLYAGAGEPFTHLGFDDPGERDIVFLETAVDDRMLEEKDELRRYMLRFEQLRAVALSAEASRDRLLKGTGYAERLGKQPSGIRVATPNPPVLIASRSAGWPGTTPSGTPRTRRVPS